MTSFAPIIKLFTSTECSQESQRLRLMIEQSGYSFTEIDLTARPDYHTQLLKRFSPDFSLPGVLWNNTTWLNMSDTPVVLHQHMIEAEALNRYQNEGRREFASNNATTTTTEESFWELQTVGTTDVESLREEMASVMMVDRDYDVFPATSKSQANASMASSETSDVAASELRPVLLPNGTSISVGTLTRLLLKVLPHTLMDQEDGKQAFCFRGSEGVELWSVLFFLPQQRPGEQTAGTVDFKKVEDFGRMLIERGILFNYTPYCQDFSKTRLALYPLKNSRVLNTFVKWPQPNKNEHKALVEDSMDILLRLSRLLDQICSQISPSASGTQSVTTLQDDPRLFHEFEVGCCQLQTVEFPEDKAERVAFLINLFNLISRHAMLLAVCNRSSLMKAMWPKDLRSLQEFLPKIGYSIGGVYMSLAYLQSCLFGIPEEEAPINITALPDIDAHKSKSFFFLRRLLSSCNGQVNSSAVVDGSEPSNICFQSRVARNDPRLLMATTWGTLSSPVVKTIYPQSLNEGLRSAVEAFVQQHVHCNPEDKVVVLPALLAWHRHDFGTALDLVLENIMPYLSVEQLRQLDRIKSETGQLHVVSDARFDWNPGMEQQSIASRPISMQSESTVLAAKAEVAHDVDVATLNTPSCFTSHIDEFTAILERAESNYTLTVPEDEYNQPSERHVVPQTGTVASTLTFSKNPEDSTTVMPPSLGRRQTSSSFLSSLFRRPQASVGEAAPPPPNQGSVSSVRKQQHDHTEMTPCTTNCDESIDDGHSCCFRSDVSEITFGSEFQSFGRRGGRRGRN